MVDNFFHEMMSKRILSQTPSAHYGFAVIYPGYMSYNAINEVYTLEELEKFVTKRKMYRVHVQGMAQHSKLQQSLSSTSYFILNYESNQILLVRGIEKSWW